MILTADLTGQTVLVAGAPKAAMRAIRRYRAAGATVHTLAASEAFQEEMLDSVAMVVAVEDAAPGWDMLPEACRRQHVLLVKEATAVRGGLVTLIGGGPGPDDLLTMRALAALKDADVVYFDRLGPHANLRWLAPGAELVDVGKRPGHHPVCQEDIQRRMVDSALQGHHVVRLKGGDPYVFGRGGEEVAACIKAEVPVTVVPGISSAISVPGAAGIPVTHRDVSRMFTVVSGHLPLAEEEYRHLAGLGGTLVILMGVGTLPQLVAGLRREGMRADMPVAIVEQGFSESQRTTVSDLAGVVTAAGSARIKSPAVLVIGEVVRQADGRTGRQELAQLTRLASAGA
ncbi:uroporphyrinogen-III C-methyltransferase [Arthrobacter sp. NPDC089319]|uniref:uroporphyrinogen-III C-methyltransferase n=1 Tax=Arthrobacter sp. NPDC089319 TaxID=3155915 RepID=UPI0034301490